jgi:hypothetical protein
MSKGLFKRIRGEVKNVLAALEGLDPHGRDEQGKVFPDWTVKQQHN